jgi:glycine dehydrogenase subunit 2
VPLAALPDGLTRQHLPLPEVSEVDVIRHFTRLSQLNYSIDTGFYPLGSCTMKYNPKINEEVPACPAFASRAPAPAAGDRPGQPAGDVRAAGIPEGDRWLCRVTLQPAAGAQGELTGVLIIRAYHHSRGDDQRTKILIPDSAHGTNPATSAMSGMRVVELPSDGRGNIDLDSAARRVRRDPGGLMLTNPNTLGLFEENIEQVCLVVHEAGGLVYGDGANMNALLGIARPATWAST